MQAIQNLLDKGDYKGALENLQKEAKTDPKVQHAYAYCLLKVGQFEAAIKEYEKLSKDQSKFLFELAYCYYAKRDASSLKKGLELLNQISSKQERELQLEAQIYYRMEEYEKSEETYQKILSQGVKSEETLTNALGSYVSAGNYQNSEQFVQSNSQVIQSSFDFAYNAACSLIDSGKYQEAEKTLKIAEANCRALLKEGYSEQDIEGDLEAIQVQLAVVLQLQGNQKQSLEIYQRLQKKKGLDESLSAVIGNNLVAIRQDHDLFDSFKKLKKSTAETLEQKLPLNQKKIIAANRCLLLLRMSKIDQCFELIKVLDEKYPGNERLALILAALFVKDKKFQKSEDHLNNFIQNHQESSVQVKLGLCQLQLERNNIKGAIQTLSSISEIKNNPGVVATLISLYDQIGDVEGSSKVLDQFLEDLLKNSGNLDLIKTAAEFKLKSKDYRGAAKWFQILHEKDPKDLQSLAYLIIATSKYDLTLSQKFASILPKSFETSNTVDVEKLEENLVVKPKSKSNQNNNNTDVNQKQNSTTEEKKTKKKKKRVRVAKNADPNKPADPERWIPLKQRSYYKPKKTKNQKSSTKQSVGAQGNQRIGESVLDKKREQIKMEAQTKEGKGTTSQPPKEEPTEEPKEKAEEKKPAKSNTTPRRNAAKKKNNKKKGF